MAEEDGLDVLGGLFIEVDHGSDGGGAFCREFLVGLEVAGFGGVADDEEEGLLS